MRCATCRRRVGPEHVTTSGRCIFCAPIEEWRPEWTSGEADREEVEAK